MSSGTRGSPRAFPRWPRPRARWPPRRSARWARWATSPRAWCWYFRHPQFPCLKRGGRRDARAARQQPHLLLGAGPGRLRDVASLRPRARPDGTRRPRDGGRAGRPPARCRSISSSAGPKSLTETVLERAEIIVAVEVPAPAAGARSLYPKDAPDTEHVGLRALRGRGVGHPGGRALGRRPHRAGRRGSVPLSRHRGGGGAGRPGAHRVPRTRGGRGRARRGATAAPERLQDRSDEGAGGPRPHGPGGRHRLSSDGATDPPAGPAGGGGPPRGHRGRVHPAPRLRRSRASLLTPEATAEDRAVFRAEYGLDRPLWVQYGRYLGRLAQGDFGQSLSFRMPAAVVALERLPATLELTLAAMVLAVVVSLPPRCWPRCARGTLFDRVLMGLTLIGQTVPTFWLGMVMILVLAVAALLPRVRPRRRPAPGDPGQPALASG